MKRVEFFLIARRRLNTRRETILRYLDERLPLVGRNEDVTDSCDDASDAEFDNVFSQLAQSDSRELAAIEYALDRLKCGVYDVCEQCGERIPRARLQAVPWATSCIQCQRQREQGGRDNCPSDPAPSSRV